MNKREGEPRILSAWWYQRGFRLWCDGEFVLVGKTNLFGKPCRPFVRVPDGLEPGQDAWNLVDGLVTAMIKKSDNAAVGALAAPTVIDVRFKKDYPTLWDWMTQTQWEDESPRETAGLTIFLQDGILKGLLKDNDQPRCLWVAGSGFFELLAALEKGLNAAVVDWRVDRKRSGTGPKKR